MRSGSDKSEDASTFDSVFVLAANVIDGGCGVGVGSVLEEVFDSILLELLLDSR